MLGSRFNKIEATASYRTIYVLLRLEDNFIDIIFDPALYLKKYYILNLIKICTGKHEMIEVKTFYY